MFPARGLRFALGREPTSGLGRIGLGTVSRRQPCKGSTDATQSSSERASVVSPPPACSAITSTGSPSSSVMVSPPAPNRGRRSPRADTPMRCSVEERADLGPLPRVRRGARRGRRPADGLQRGSLVPSRRLSDAQPRRAIGHQRQPAVHRGPPAEAHGELPNVTIETGVNVVGLICDGGHVRGVQLKQDDAEQTSTPISSSTVRVALSSAAHWLEDIGYPSPRSSRCTATCGTRR